MTVWTKTTLRLPIQVHNALADAAKEADISLNQLILDRLNASVGGVYVSEDAANNGDILNRMNALEARMERLEAKASKRD